MRSLKQIGTVGGFFLVIISGSAQTKNAQPPETTNLIESIQGSALYSAYCALCHGKDGRGEGPLAKSLRVSPAIRPAWLREMAALFRWIEFNRLFRASSYCPRGTVRKRCRCGDLSFRRLLGTKTWDGCA